MKRSTLAASGLTLGALILVLVLFFVTPVGRFLQSNLFQGNTYLSRDTGLYIGVEQTTSSGKLLKADQGLRVRAVPGKSGSTNIVDIYFQVVNNADALNANSFKAVVSYNKDQLTMRDTSSIVPLTGNTLDQGFTEILRASDNSETGTIYVGVDKSADFLKPTDEVLRLRFEAKNSSVTSSQVAINTLRLYKRENLSESTAATLYVARNEGDRTVAEAVPVLFDGTTSEITESQATGGGIIRREVQKNSSGATVKTIETTYDTSNRIVRVHITYPNGDFETSIYEYSNDGSYRVTTTKRINGITSAESKAYNKNGVLQTTTTTNANSNSNGSNSTGNANTNSGGVTVAVTNTNTNNTSAVNTNAATTTATTCSAPAAERFNDTIGHWSADIVEQARQKCIISGKSLGRFAPDEPVTRAELTKIAVEAFKVAQANGVSGFSDVSDSEWYATYVRAAKLADIVSGYSDGSFKPNNQVNRAEALKIILEAGVKTRGQQLGMNLDTRFSSWLNQNPTFTYVRFPDVQIADWFGKYVLTGFERGVVRGYNDRGTDVFRPGQPVTRAEAVKMIMTLVQ